MMFPMVFGRLVDALQAEEAQQSLVHIARGLTIIMSFAAFATAARVSTMGIVGERIARRLRIALYSSIMHQELEFFGRRSSGELVNRLSADVTAVSGFLTDNLTRIVRSTATSTTGVCALFYLSPKLASVCVLVLPFAAFSSSLLGRRVRALSQEVQDKLAGTTQTAAEKLSALRTVRLFGAEEKETKLYSSRVEESFSVATKLARVEGIYTGANFLVANLTLASVLYVGGSMVINSEVSIGTLTSVCMYMVNLGFGVSNLANGYGQLLRAQGCAERIHTLMNRTPKFSTSTMASSSSGRPSSETLRNGEPLLRYDHASFEFTEGKPLLHDVNLDVWPGEIVLVRGPSGSGKSTLLALASRLYEPTSGQVRVSGKDVRDWNPKLLRQRVGVVPQDVVLFEGTVAENISYGLDGAEKDELQSAAQKCGADSFVNTLPQKFETRVEERGGNLSGGQKKLIGLARAMMRNPSVLILDEALTGLDTETESRVAQALKSLSMSDLGILMIAHGNGCSVQIADRVVNISSVRPSDQDATQPGL
eukprot:CAMPEP_0113968506 /NCGR_PEP_ID=MMETSP0011_2-20120614/9583_1 /TAXON_ID=101924 /ORGANISM="Rhodosorus marinus" /LENGTH=536 /DNA_ID=CAMNT_0000981627 /DNA_START=854 /DNA_END=2464 /DNA_ORIENTATION=- /assembly_acc=CAM_ASM_000156